MAPSPALALLLLCLPMASPAAAQQTFRDADFDFSFDVPEGLSPLPEAEARQLFGIPEGTPFNPSRDQVESGKLIHQYYWHDTEGRGSGIKLMIQDLPLPFTRPDEFADYLRTTVSDQESVEILEQKPLEPPKFKPGLTAELERTDPNGVKRRMLWVYYPLGRERFALMYMQGLPADWKPLRKSYERVLESVRFTGEQAAGGTGKKGGSGQPRSKPMQAPGRRGKSSNSEAAAQWSGLEVTGSLVLAAVMLMGLFTGGRRS